MSESDARPAPESDDADGAVELVARLLDEIRADLRWRNEINPPASVAVEADSAPSDEAAETEADDAPAPATHLAAPEPDAALRAALAAITAALRAADAVVPIETGRPVIGEAWAILRRQIHADIRIYQDRQTIVNQQLLAALLRLGDALDGESPRTPIGAVWGVAVTLAARVSTLEGQLANLDRRRLGSLERRLESLERRLDGELRGVTSRLADLERAVEALTLEVEPLGEVRAALLERSAPSRDA